MKSGIIQMACLAGMSLLLASCVATRKYEASEAHVRALQADSARLQASIRKLTVEKLGLEADKITTEQSLAQQLIIKQNELNQKEKELAQREQRVSELQRVIVSQNQSMNLLHASISKALIHFRPEELSIEIRDARLYVSLQEELLFKTGSAKVDPKGIEALGKLAGVLNEHPDVDIIIEGHTDTVPISKKYDDNWDLSVNRAISISRILHRKYHVDPRRLIASGRAEYFPVETNNTAAGRARNRRTELILAPKLNELYRIIGTK